MAKFLHTQFECYYTLTYLSWRKLISFEMMGRSVAKFLHTRRKSSNFDKTITCLFIFFYSQLRFRGIAKFLHTRKKSSNFDKTILYLFFIQTGSCSFTHNECYYTLTYFVLIYIEFFQDDGPERGKVPSYMQKKVPTLTRR